MTQRSKGTLDGLFAANTSGDIEPVDLLDFVDSSVHSHGSLYVSSAVATTIAVAGTFVKMLGSTSLVGGHRFTMPANNRLTYTGTISVHAHIVVNLSTTSSGNNQVLQFAVAQNGTLLDHSIMEHKIT